MCSGLSDRARWQRDARAWASKSLSGGSWFRLSRSGGRINPDAVIVKGRSSRMSSAVAIGIISSDAVSSGGSTAALNPENMISRFRSWASVLMIGSAHGALA